MLLFYYKLHLIFFLRAVKNQRFGGQNKSVLNYHKLSMFQNKFLLLWRGVIPLYCKWHLCFPEKKSTTPLFIPQHQSVFLGFDFHPPAAAPGPPITLISTLIIKRGSREEKCKLDKNLYRIYEITTLINLTFFVRLKVNLWQAGHDFY